MQRFAWQKQPPEVFKVSGLQLFQKETPTQVFSCKYCKNLKNTYIEENQRTAASGLRLLISRQHSKYDFTNTGDIFVRIQFIDNSYGLSLFWWYI